MVTVTRVDYPPAGPRPWGPRSTHFPVRSGPSIQRLPAPGEAIFLRRKAACERKEESPGEQAEGGGDQQPEAAHRQACLCHEGVPALKDSRGTTITYCSFLLKRLEGSFCFCTFEEDDIWNSEGFWGQQSESKGNLCRFFGM